MSKIARQILKLYKTKGQGLMPNSTITHRDHAIQCWRLSKGHQPDFKASAFLHDIGKLVKPSPKLQPYLGLAGVLYLESKGFDFSVVRTIELNILAKRYLCSTKYLYYSNMPYCSRLSYLAQGGHMSHREKEHFFSLPYHYDALILRTIDDRAHEDETPPLSQEEERALLSDLSDNVFDTAVA